MGFKVSIINQQDGDVVGVKTAELEINGDFAYGTLKGENGVHRLVRVSPQWESGWLSFNICSSPGMRTEVQINPARFEWGYLSFQWSGDCQQTESAVRSDTCHGIVVECQQERSQHQNRDKAMQAKSKLYERELQRQLEERDKVEATKMKNE